MGLEPSRPAEETQDNPEKNHFIERINRADLHNTRSLINITHPTLGYMASLYWVGKAPASFRDVYQPAIYCPAGVFNRYLAYDGKANFIKTGIGNDYEFLRYPHNEVLFTMSPDTLHYFTTSDPLSPNYTYALKANNMSIIMDNISIYNEHYTCGCMLNLRASFEGKMVDDDISGNVIILCTVDYIG